MAAEATSSLRPLNRRLLPPTLPTPLPPHFDLIISGRVGLCGCRHGLVTSSRGNPLTSVILNFCSDFVLTAVPGALAAPASTRSYSPELFVVCVDTGFDRGAGPCRLQRGKVRHDAATLVLCNLG